MLSKAIILSEDQHFCELQERAEEAKLKYQLTETDQTEIDGYIRHLEEVADLGIDPKHVPQDISSHAGKVLDEMRKYVIHLQTWEPDDNPISQAVPEQKQFTTSPIVPENDESARLFPPVNHVKGLHLAKPPSRRGTKGQKDRARKEKMGHDAYRKMIHADECDALIRNHRIPKKISHWLAKCGTNVPVLAEIYKEDIGAHLTEDQIIDKYRTAANQGGFSSAKLPNHGNRTTGTPRPSPMQNSPNNSPTPFMNSTMQHRPMNQYMQPPNPYMQPRNSYMQPPNMQPPNSFTASPTFNSWQGPSVGAPPSFNPWPTNSFTAPSSQLAGPQVPPMYQQGTPMPGGPVIDDLMANQARLAHRKKELERQMVRMELDAVESEMSSNQHAIQMSLNRHVPNTPNPSNPSTGTSGTNSQTPNNVADHPERQTPAFEHTQPHDI